MNAARKREAKIVAGIYLASAAFVLLQFWLAPPDGLANIRIAMWTLPVILVGIALLCLPFGVEFRLCRCPVRSAIKAATQFASSLSAR